MKKIIKFLLIAFLCVFCFILITLLNKDFDINLNQSIENSVDKFFDETLKSKKFNNSSDTLK